MLLSTYGEEKIMKIDVMNTYEITVDTNTDDLKHLVGFVIKHSRRHSLEVTKHIVLPSSRQSLTLVQRELSEDAKF